MDYFICFVEFKVLVSEMEFKVCVVLKERYNVVFDDFRGIGGFNF